MQADRLLFRPDVESPSELLLLGGTRVMHELTIDNTPNTKLVVSRDTGPLLEIRLLEEGGRGISGAAVTGGERFCM